MDNIINFPSHIIEKEKELARLEYNLHCDKMLLQREIEKARTQRVRRVSDLVVSFSLGMIVMSTIMLLMQS
tara:strand:+ start:131 stop:343 length:213 start_codon:yes stop_codon:yes gene_type:complete